jgi:hypothetical protein
MSNGVSLPTPTILLSYDVSSEIRSRAENMRSHSREEGIGYPKAFPLGTHSSQTVAV